MPGADAACSLLLALLLHSLHLRALCVSLDASVSVASLLHFLDEGDAHGDGLRSAAQRVRGTDDGEGCRGTIAIQTTAQGIGGRETTHSESEARMSAHRTLCESFGGRAGRVGPPHCVPPAQVLETSLQRDVFVFLARWIASNTHTIAGGLRKEMSENSPHPSHTRRLSRGQI